MNIYLLLIVIYIISIGFTPKKYKWYLPTIPVYPINDHEVLLVKDMVMKRGSYDIDFFKKTDQSVSYVFSKIVPESQKEIGEMITNSKVYVPLMFFKYLINRPRPKQILPELNILHSNTADTPAYPAGHAYQAYYLAKVFGKKYPYLKHQLDNLAYQCDITRVKAGIHYPSDGRFAKQLVESLYT